MAGILDSFKDTLTGQYSASRLTVFNLSANIAIIHWAYVYSLANANKLAFDSLIGVLTVDLLAIAVLIGTVRFTDIIRFKNGEKAEPEKQDASN
jgi:hypothetical protein